MTTTTQGVSDIVKQQPLVVAGVAFVVGLLLLMGVVWRAIQSLFGL